MAHQPDDNGDGDLWRSAFERLPASTAEKLGLAKSHVRSIHATLRLAHERYETAKKKRWKFNKANGDEVVIRDVLEKIVRWLSLFKSIGDNAVQFDPIHASLPWSAFRFVLQAAVNTSDMHADAVQSLELVARVVSQLRQVEALYRHRQSDMLEQLESALVKAYTSILELLASAVHFFSASTTSRLLKAPFHMGAQHLQRTVSAAEAEVYKLANLIDASRLLQVETLVTRLADVALSCRESVEEEKYVNVARWLSQVPDSRIHGGIDSTRIPGTGKWLLQHSDFRLWAASSSSSQLLLHGIPGSGKTALCSAVVSEYLGDDQVTSSRVPVAYFYCSASESERERRSARGALGSLARQLTVSRTTPLSVHAAVLTTYDRLAEDARLDGFALPEPTLPDLVKFILAALDDNPATIIIDALDELEDATLLVKAVDEITAKSSNVVKILLFSRDGPVLSTISQSCPRIRITEEYNGQDVRDFVIQSVDTAISDGELLDGTLADALRNAIVDALTSQAGEMFRWVELQLLRLCDFKVKADVVDALSHLDDFTLDHLYQAEYVQIYNRAGKSGQELITRTFAWLLYMKESLTPNALSSAVAAASDMAQLTTADQLVSLCRGFVYLDLHMDTVRFAHSSAREFLLLQPALAPCAAQNLLGLGCLSVCNDPPLNAISKLEPRRDIYHYATLYYGHHCSAAGRNGTSETLHREICAFALDDDSGPSISLRIWMDNVRAAYSSLPDEHALKLVMQLVSHQECSPLFPIVVFGLSSVLQLHQWPDEVSWDICNDSGHSLLYAAAFCGHSDVVQYLLARGTPVNLECGKFGSAVHCAAFYGHTQVVNFLLRREANVHLGSKFESAFHAACRAGHEETALTVLDYTFADLSQADFNSYLNAVLESGLSLALDRLRKHPLSYRPKLNLLSDMSIKAISSGKVANLQYCLRNATLAEAVPEGAVALSALHGHEPMTAFLLDQGADVGQPGDLGSPLRCASLNGHEHVCRLLLSYGAKVNDEERLGNALYAATFRGHLKTVQLLLDSGAHANIKGGYFGTCIQAAASCGYESILKCLLSAGANPLLPGYSKDAFHAAAEAGKHHIIHLLLEAGFAPKEPIRQVERASYALGLNCSRSVLRRSAMTRHVDTRHDDWRVGLGGYKPREQEDYALEAAAAFGQLSAVSAVLLHGDSLQLSHRQVENAVLAACRSGHADAALMILQREGLAYKCIRAALRETVSHDHISLALSLLEAAIPAPLRARRLRIALLGSAGADSAGTYHVPRWEHSSVKTTGMLRNCRPAAAAIKQGNVVSLLQELEYDVEEARLLDILTTCCHDGRLAAVAIVREVLQLHLGDALELAESIILQRLFGFYAERVSAQEVRETLLMLTDRDDIEAVSLLLQLPLNIFSHVQLAKDEALGSAARNGQANACARLICEGADPTRCIEWDQKQHCICSKRRSKWRDLPLPRDEDCSCPSKGNALRACLAGYQRFYRYLSEQEQQAQDQTMLVILASVPSLESPVWKAIMSEAIQVCSPRVISDILDKGTARDAQLNGDSILTCALRRELDTWPVFNMLLQTGPGIEEMGDDLQSLLHTVMQHFCLHDVLPDTPRLEDVFLTGPGAAAECLLRRLPDEQAEGRSFVVLLECAAAVGQAGLVDLLIRRGVHVNGEASYYGNSLQAASRLGHVGIVKQLLLAGANPNSVQGRYGTALIAAVCGLHVQTTKVLLEAGADTELQDEGGGTALQLAARPFDANMAIFKALVSAGANVNAAAEGKTRLLTNVCRTGDASAVRAFLETDAAFLSSSAHGHKSHMYSLTCAAIQAGHLQVLEEILSHGFDLTQDFAPDEAPLLHAVRCHDKVIFDVTYKASQPANAATLSRALLVAIESCRDQVVHQLISDGAVLHDPAGDINMSTAAFKSGSSTILATLLEQASCDGLIDYALDGVCRHLLQGDEGLLQVLLDYISCSVEMFAIACARDYGTVVRRGLEQGLNRDTVDGSGWPALNIAAACGSASAVELLLHHDTHVATLVDSGHSAIRAALEGCALERLLSRKLPEEATAYAQVLKALQRGKTDDQTWIHVQENSSIERQRAFPRVVDLLLAHGAAAETQPGIFGSALTLAAFLGHNQIFGKLKSHGARLSTRGGFLDSPLAAAIQASCSDLIQEILDHGSGVQPESLIPACLNSTLSTVEMVLYHPSSPFPGHTDTASPTTQCWPYEDDTLYFDDSSLQPDFGYIITILLDSDVAFPMSDELIAAVISCRNEGLRQQTLPKMIARMSTPHFPEKAFVDLVWKCSWSKFERSLARQLLDEKRILRVTTRMLNAADDTEMVQQLLDYDSSYVLTADDFDTLVSRFGGPDGLAATLIQRRRSFVPRESNIVTFLELPEWRSCRQDEEFFGDRSVLEILFERNPELTVTDDMLKAVTQPSQVRFLLDRCDPGNGGINEEVLSRVTQRSSFPEEMLWTVVDYNPSMSIPTKVADSYVNKRGIHALERLWTHDPAICISEGPLARIARARQLAKKNYVEPFDGFIRLLEEHKAQWQPTQRLQQALDDMMQQRYKPLR